eukprot:gb/GEZN01001765.1/.p1 GENE.gb/GEZN01001765.1/~~gb/GEZN01001765.1/.p1  ORF type:complete len:685 (+),score=59.89 gb/GEZN01001765.1/:167-2221(+)
MVGGPNSISMSLMMSRPPPFADSTTDESRGSVETDPLPSEVDDKHNTSRLRSLMEGLSLRPTTPELNREESPHSAFPSRLFGPSSYLPKEQPYQRARTHGAYLEHVQQPEPSLFSEEQPRFKGVYIDHDTDDASFPNQHTRKPESEDFPDVIPNAAMRSVSSPSGFALAGSSSKTSPNSGIYGRQGALQSQPQFIGGVATRPTRISRSSSSVERGAPGYSQQHDEKYKTELCKKFSKFGSCRYAQKCQFAHGEEELRNLPRHRKYKTEMCKNLLAKGHCPYGTRCRFLHDDDDSNRDSSSQQLNTLDWSPPKSPRSRNSEPDSSHSSPSKSPSSNRLIRFPELAGPAAKAGSTISTENSAWGPRPDTRPHRSVSFGQGGDEEQLKKSTPMGWQPEELNDEWTMQPGAPEPVRTRSSGGTHVLAPKYPRDYALTPDSGSAREKSFWSETARSTRTQTLESVSGKSTRLQAQATRTRSSGSVLVGDRVDRDTLARVPPPPVGSRSYSFSSRSSSNSSRSSYLSRGSEETNRDRTTSTDNMVSSWSSISSAGSSMSAAGLLLSSSAPGAGDGASPLSPTGGFIRRNGAGVTFADQGDDGGSAYRFSDTLPMSSASAPSAPSELEQSLEQPKEKELRSSLQRKCISVPRAKTAATYEYYDQSQVKLPFYPSLDLRSRGSEATHRLAVE